MRQVLVTGATRMVGAHLAVALAKRAGTERVYLLMREDDERSRSMLRRQREHAGAAGAELRCLWGDVRARRFGLNNVDWDELSREPEAVFHCAESPRLGMSLEAARREHVAPAWNLIELMEGNDRIRLGFLSTAFVAGRRRGLFTEFDLYCRQTFNNAWERSRFEAELTLWHSPVRERTTVFRPSLVAGDSRSGSALALGGVFYDVLRLLRQRRRGVIACDALARLDIVPVNYVADAMVRLFEMPEAAGRRFHLVAGWSKSVPVGAFIGRVSSYGRPGRRGLRLLPPVLAPFARGLGVVTLGALSPYSPLCGAYRSHMTQPAVFDDFGARTLLRDSGLACPPVESYLDKVLEFAEASGWGARVNETPPAGIINVPVEAAGPGTPA